MEELTGPNTTARLLTGGGFFVPSQVGIEGLASAGCGWQGADVTPRPFFRSRAFWFGLPGLVFLLWAWWFSMGTWSKVGFAAGMDGPCLIGQEKGEVFACWDSSGSPNWGRFKFWNSSSTADGLGAKGFLAITLSVWPTTRYFIIPHHWLVLTYAIAWLSAVAWWQRRKARLLTLHASPET